MAINKNFVIKNGAEINTNLFVADSSTNKIWTGIEVSDSGQTLNSDSHRPLKAKKMKV